MNRIILHSDLNCFYASCEMLYNPNYRNTPFAVAGDVDERHGIILTKNAIAKSFGIKTGEAIWQAKLKCPDLICSKPNYSLYLRYSKMVKQIYYDYTDRVESFGIDEAWLDITESVKLFKSAEDVAYQIKERIKFELGLTVSIGVANNKIYAKLGSDLAGVNDYFLAYNKDKETTIYPLDVSNLLYVGRQTIKKLHLFDIYTIGDLANKDVNFLKKHLGKMGEMLWTFANGLDTTEVSIFNSSIQIKSIGNSTTCIRDLVNYNDVKIIFTILAESVAARMKEQGFYCRVVSIYIRNNKLETAQYQTTLNEVSDLATTLIEKALFLFKNNYDFKLPIRSLGITASQLTYIKNHTQINLFSDEEYDINIKNLENAIDNIRKRFGHKKIQKGIIKTDPYLSNFSPKEEHIIFPESYFRR